MVWRVRRERACVRVRVRVRVRARVHPSHNQYVSLVESCALALFQLPRQLRPDT